VPLPIFVIGKHHLGRCLHILTMATLLRENSAIPLNFTSGTILVLKPSSEQNGGHIVELPFDLKLFNATDDILLHISFSTTGITFKDCAIRSLGDGRGKEQYVYRNFNRSVTYGETVSVHHYLTDSEFGRYQILLNGVTVYHFDKRLPGPATQISYTYGSGSGSPMEVVYMSMFRDQGLHFGDLCWAPSYWNFSVYQIGDLLPEDQLALGLGPERYIDI
jgi:hypothetical protein